MTEENLTPDTPDSSHEGWDPRLEDIMTEEVNRVLEELREKRRQGGCDPIAAARENIVWKYKIALKDIRTRILHWDAGGKQRAEILAQRHNQYLIGQTFVNTIVRYASTADPQCVQVLEDLRTRARSNGFFLFPYNSAFMAKRLGSEYEILPDHRRTPCHVIAEAGGPHPDPTKGSLHHPGVWAADCQIHLPAPVSKAEPVVPLPIHGDDVHIPGWEEWIRAHPSEVALIADLVCLEEMSGFTLASTAMERAMEEIVKNINPLRGRHRIRFLAGEIASLQGVELPDGTILRLGYGSLKSIPPISNDRSMYVVHHYQSMYCSSFNFAYRLRERKYPILLPGDTQESSHKIIVDWWVEIAELRDLDERGAGANLRSTPTESKPAGQAMPKIPKKIS